MPVYCEQRAGREPVWVADLSAGGRRYRRRFVAKRDAQRWCSRVKAGASPDAPITITIGEAAAFCRRERTDWAAGKDPSLWQRLDLVLAHFGAQTALEAIGATELQVFVNTLRAREGRRGALSPATINRYLAVVSGIMEHARRTGRSAHVPQVPWQEESEGKLEWLTREQEDALARSMPSKHALILRVLCATGLRAGELWGLKTAHIEAQWLRLWDTKSGKPRSVPIDPSLSRPLRQLVETRSLPSYREHYRMFKRMCASLGLSPTLSVHSTRHTTGTRLAAVAPGPVVQKFLGHSDYSMTQRYVHLADEELMRAADALKPSLTVIGRTA